MSDHHRGGVPNVSMTWSFELFITIVRGTKGSWTLTTSEVRERNVYSFIEVWPDARIETFDHYRVFTLRAIGSNQWTPSISCQRGYAKILKNEASSGRRCAAAILSTGSPSRCYQPTVVWEIKRVSDFHEFSHFYLGATIKFDTVVMPACPFNSMWL